MRRLTDSRLPTLAALLSIMFWMLPVTVLTGQDVQSVNENDQKISDQVDDELLYDQAVLSHKIDVDTNQGIVRLTGDVNNLLAKRRAAKIAQSVRGVRAVVNDIEVSVSSARSDTAIQSRIENALLIDSATESYEVTPTVDNGHATLKGTVDSWQEKQLSEKVAAGVHGVTGVTNSIEVEYASNRSNSEIENEIRKILKWDIYVPNDPMITVEASDGEVTLSGTVGSLAEKTRAFSRAWVAGVTSVDHSKVDVEGWTADPKTRNDAFADVADEEIRDAVIDAMLYDPHVNSFNVRAEVFSGIVTLRGKVDNLKAKRQAAQNARNTVGVHSVQNRLKVRLTDNFPADEMVEERIEDALIQNPYVQSYEITTVVDNGLVDLYGTVDSFFEKSQAEEAASNVRGAVVIDNNIVVTNSTIPYVYDPYVDDFDYDYKWNRFDASTHLKLNSEIKDDIESELFWSPFVDSDQVSVKVDDGTATLTGTVDSWSERLSAEENAMEGGADNVINNLSVQ